MEPVELEILGESAEYSVAGTAFGAEYSAGVGFEGITKTTTTNITYGYGAEGAEGAGFGVEIAEDGFGATILLFLNSIKKK